MFQILVAILLNAVLVLGQQQQPLGEAQPPTRPQFYPAVKCTFPVFGQFDYQQAKEACASRNTTLAFFATQSEEKRVRQSIEWNLMPGYPMAEMSGMGYNQAYSSHPLAMMMKKMNSMDSNKWTGQLWIAVKRIPNNPQQWYWDVPGFPQMPIPWSPFIGSSNTQGYDCAVARADGWSPMNCSAIENGKQSNIGALCTTGIAFPPSSDVVASSSNYCGNYLVPHSPSNVALPMVVRKTFFLVRGQFTHDQADGVCNSQRGRLATSRSIEEFDFIPKNVNFPSVGGRAWMNLKRAPGTNTFLWNDGFANILTNAWYPGQPEQSGDCVAFEQANSAAQPGWRVYQCSQQMSVLCETFMML